MTTLPAGWKLVPIEMTQVMRDAGNRTLDMLKSEPGMSIADRAFYAYGAMLAAAPIPPASAQDDAKDDIDVLNWLQIEISALDCRYLGDPSYDHDAYWMRDRVLKLIEDARKAFPAPAAGDAQLLAALQQAHMALIGFMPQHRNAVIVNVIVAAREAIDAAIAAQQGKGGNDA
ncbi:hypothetical protein ACTJNK_26095 [Achromobacter anxifer]